MKRRWSVPLTALLLCWLAGEASALPMYAMRSGRTCGNCHSSPTYEDQKGWDNPEVAARKCNLSCMVCHVNPGGGGMRNTSGRYYGQSTLSALPFQERSYSDGNRELLSDEVMHDVRTWLASARPPAVTSPATVAKRSIPSSHAEVRQGIGRGAGGALVEFGSDRDDPSKWAFWGGRYGDLKADPALALGGDFRVGFSSSTGKPFPMQFDLHAAAHPLEHITMLGTLAVGGSVAAADAREDKAPPLFARNAILMVHELPYMSYLKAGIFQPSFGTYVDDHTSFIRKNFEMDVSQPENRALGVELGAAANYPFVQIGVFRNMDSTATVGDGDAGHGATLGMGWCDLGWSLTLHGMLKRRPQSARGDLTAAGVAWGFNPFYYSNRLPLTVLGEFSIGQRQRSSSGDTVDFFALYNELWLTVVNGVSLRFKHDLGDRDTSVGDRVEQRLSAGIEVSPVVGLTFTVQARTLLSKFEGRDSDLFLQTHLWF